MNTIKNSFALMGVFLLLSSFSLTNTISKQLIGKWVMQEYNEASYVYHKVDKLELKKPGLEFREDSSFFKRQNATFCGTPPITYENYEGTWSLENDKQVIIRYDYRGQNIKQYIELIELTNKLLVIKFDIAE